MITTLILAATFAQPGSPLPAEVAREVSAERAKADVEKLASFGTRHTLSDTESDSRGIGAARRWLKQQFESYGGRLQVSFEEFDAPKMQRLPDGAHLVNVVAVLPGTMPEAADRRYYVVGHYDTINGDRMDPKGDAPGANDDGSGTTVVLECARVFANRNLDATVVFLCVAAEEQGLVGSKMHADAAKGRGEHILGVLSNDIVGDPSPKLLIPANASGSDFVTQKADNVVRLFSEALPRSLPAEQLASMRQLGSESDSPSRQLARYIFTVASREDTAVKPWVIFRADRFLRGGDHASFNEAGFTAVRFSVPAEDYSRQHATVTTRDGEPYGDLAKFVDGEYVANVARLNATVLVHLANAPRPPADARLVTAQLETGTTIRWSKSPEPDVAGYDIVWRSTTAWQWEGSKDVGNVTEVSRRVSKDNFFFDVRAYYKDNYKSPVAFCAAAQR